MTANHEHGQDDPGRRSIPEKKKRAPDVVAENKERVITAWLERVKTNPELIRLNLSDEQRSDHVPDLLEEAVSRACGRHIHAEGRQRAAELHGAVRYHQGYSIAMLILEAQLLQHVMAECIRDKVQDIEVATLITDIAKLSDTVTTELRESARAYMNERDRQSKGQQRKT